MSSPFRPTVFQLLTCLLVVQFIVLGQANSSAQTEMVVQLSNGMNLGPGVLTETGTISTNSFGKGGSQVDGKSIWILNDGLRKTYFNRAPVNTRSIAEYTGPPLTEVTLPNALKVATSGNRPNVLSNLSISPFNKYGRRSCTVLTNRGKVDYIQGITLLTPKYFKLQVLRTESKFVWESREATSTIPPADLRAILYQVKDLTKAADWLDIVSFYMQAERYSEAADVMTEALDRFRSELADRQPLLTQLKQLTAEKRFDEIGLMQDAGQHKQAVRFLSSFPKDEMSFEAQDKLSREIGVINKQLADSAQIAASLRQHVDQLPAVDQQAVKPIVDEILGELTFETLPRLSDYNRLRSDDSIAVDEKVSLAIGGWLIGAGSGLDNLAVAKSVTRVRGLVIEYLNDASPPRRQQILEQLRGEEGAQAPILAKLLSTMKPPQLPPLEAESDPPGLYRLEVTTSANEKVRYLVQVPPEYDPNRKYPCVLALGGSPGQAELELNAWCGQYRKLAFASARTGFATRNGYIVIAPEWMTESQGTYNYTEQEHNRILTCMRDGFRRFSVDTNRVFCTGHFAGGTAAWDLAVSHPDLWAGAVLISPTAEKFIVHYHQNVKGPRNDLVPLGTYIVYGELGGNRNSDLGSAASQYVESSFYDSIVVEYIGRGAGLFLEEMPRVFEWMDLTSHRRKPTPAKIETRTMRAGDRFFYWLEAPLISNTVAQNAYQMNPANSGKFSATFVRDRNNIRVSSIPSGTKKSALVWLTPDMVDFTKPVTVSVGGKGSRYDVKPDIRVMLEDVRTRADRDHVFWQRISIE